MVDAGLAQYAVVARISDIGMRAVTIASIGLIAACATDGSVPMIGSRPLIYKQGPGDEAAARQARATPAVATGATAAVPVRTASPVSAQQAPVAVAPVSTPGTAASGTAAANTSTVTVAAPATASTAATQATSANAVAGQSAAAPIAGALPPALGRYTQATRYGDLLFLSGQIGVDPRTGDFAPDAPIEQQTRQAMENVRAILEANGLTMANIVSVTVYVANLNTLGAVDTAYAPFFKTALPARSVVEAQRLPRGAQVEITVVAGR